MASLESLEPWLQMNEELRHQKGKTFILMTPAVQIIQYFIHSVGFYAVELKALHPIICRSPHM